MEYPTNFRIRRGMDNLTFSIRLIEALTWPVAAVIIVFIFRSEFRGLVPLLRKLKVGPLVAEFEREILEISNKAAGMSAEFAADHDKAFYRELAATTPRGAIALAWTGVESAVESAMEEKLPSLSVPGKLAPNRAINELARIDAISSSDVELYHDLKRWHDDVNHVPEFKPSYQAALHFGRLADQIRMRIEGRASPDDH